MAKKQEVQVVSIPQIEVARMTIKLVGDSPLIMHKWSEKAKKEMLDKQMKVATKGRTAKNPVADFEACIYYLDENDPKAGYGFPTIAFKASAVSACRFTDGTKMTVARGAFHIEGELVPLTFKGKPKMREDMVKINMGVADIRYRPEFFPWEANVQIDYNTHALSKEQIINLFNLAGFGVGVGEWRPEKNGQMGRFHVE